MPTALPASEARFRAAADSSPAGIIETDAGGACVYANRRWLEISGRTFEEIQRDGWLGAIHPEDRESSLQAWAEARRDLTPLAREFRVLQPDGAVRWVRSRTAFLRAEDRVVGQIVTIEDVTDLRLAEEQSRESAAEREALTRERNHRVKNNLHVVSSLLQLRSGAIRDPDARAHFRECQRQVRVIALVYAKLLDADNLTEIDFAGYLRALVSLLTRVEAGESIIETELVLEAAALDMDLAIPVGLIAAELISNSVRHAFVNRTRGCITVRFNRAEDDKWRLTVTDDGCGLPEAFDPAAAETVGMRVVNALVGQIGGNLVWSRHGGAHFELRFPDGT